MKRNANGFTIVELLIVIVVIAILAAISIVAYTGIQQRATNTQIVSVVQAYQKALSMYRVSNEGAVPYPTQASANVAYSNCLGTGYTLDGDYCSRGVWETRESSATQTRLRTVLAEFMPSVPKLKPSRYYNDNEGNIRAGAFYLPGHNVLTSGTASPNRPRIVYYLNGTNQDCAVGGAERSAGWGGQDMTVCTLYLPYE